MRVTAPSAWPWLDHSVSGLPPATERPVQTRFRCAYAYRLKLARQIKSLAHYTKGTWSPRTNLGLPLFVGIRFQVYFTPLVGVLFTFPSRYLFTIGHQGVFRLGGWSPHVQTGFHVSRLTQGPVQHLRIRGCHPLWPDFPDRSAFGAQATGLFRVRSPLLAESLLMSVPPGTEMFQFPGFASFTYVFSERYPCGWVAPFGYPRINACSRLPMAFRSVPRPSSPPGAKASTECPYHTPIQSGSRLMPDPPTMHGNHRQTHVVHMVHVFTWQEHGVSPVPSFNRDRRISIIFGTEPGFPPIP